MITVVRGIAKITRLEMLLITNSFVHYTAVCIFSVTASLILERMLHEVHKKKCYTGRAWIELDKTNLYKNVDTLRQLLPAGCELMPAVKANAYGVGTSGLKEVFEKEKIQVVVVATIEEGIKLKEQGYKQEIITLNELLPYEAKKVVEYELVPGVSDLEVAYELNNQALLTDKKIKIHVEVDTGMGRVGKKPEEILDFVKEISKLSNIEIESLSMHIGSQILDPAPLNKAITVMKGLIEEVKSIGFNIKAVDIGGGYGVRYDKSSNGFDFEKFKKESINLLKDMKLSITTEPGRYFIAEAGALIMKVEYVKEEWGKKYIILNGGMNDYIRAAMYDAHNEIVPLIKRDGKEQYQFVGPICESSDVFANDRECTTIEAGDYVALIDSGAYGFSMASNYNSRTLISQVMIDKNNHYIIRKPQTFEEMISYEII